MKHATLFILCLFALASFSFAQNDSLNVRTVGSWQYYSCISVATGHAAGHHVALIHCRGGVTTVNIDIPSAPTWFGEVAIKDSCMNLLSRPRDIHVQDTLAYMSLGKSGFAIVDFSDPEHPALRSQVTPPGEIVRSAVCGNYLYAADDSFGLRVYDATNPSNPVQMSMIASNKGCWGVARKDTFLFISVQASTSNAYIISLNIADPANPVVVDSLSVAAAPYFIVSGSCLYAAGFAPIVDIGDPSNMFIRSNTPIYGSNGKMVIADTVLYTPNIAGFSGYLFYNVANPNNVTQIRTYPSEYYARDVYLEGSTLYLADELGMSIVDVSDPASPVKLGYFEAPGIWGIGAEANGHLFIGNDALHVFDITDSSNPHQVSCLAAVDSLAGFSEIALKDSLIAGAEWGYGVRLFNATDPLAVFPLDTIALTGGCRGVSLKDTIAVAASDAAGIHVVSIASPFDMFEIGAYDTPGHAQKARAYGSKVYVADGDSGLLILDITNPAVPTRLGSLNTGNALDLCIRNDTVYLANGGNGLRIVDATDPSNPQTIGICNTPGNANGVALDGALAYITDDTMGLRVIDVANAAVPVEKGHYKIPSLFFMSNIMAEGVTVAGGLAYVSYVARGLQVFRYYGPNGVTGANSNEIRITNTLGQNRPNPFTASTSIRYQLSAPGAVTLSVYNVAGQKVRTLVSGKQQAGAHEVNWNGRNGAGRQLSAGVYFCRLETTERTMTAKLVKVK
jgi:hypothetical protein